MKRRWAKDGKRIIADFDDVAKQKVKAIKKKASPDMGDVVKLLLIIIDILVEDEDMNDE